MDSDVKKLAYRHTKEPAEITIKSREITLDTIRSYALSGVDFISSGELTHSVKAFDISLKNFTKI